MLNHQDNLSYQAIHAEDERIPVESVAFGAEAIYKVLQRFQEGK